MAMLFSMAMWNTVTGWYVIVTSQKPWSLILQGMRMHSNSISSLSYHSYCMSDHHSMPIFLKTKALQRYSCWKSINWDPVFITHVFLPFFPMNSKCLSPINPRKPYGKIHISLGFLRRSHEILIPSVPLAGWDVAFAAQARLDRRREMEMVERSLFFNDINV